MLIFKKIVYGHWYLLNHSDEIFDAHSKFALGTQALLALYDTALTTTKGTYQYYVTYFFFTFFTLPLLLVTTRSILYKLPPTTGFT